MKVSCLRENLTDGVSAVGHLALRATGLPVLSNILLRAKKNTLSLIATNLETGIRYDVRGKVEEGGECLILAKPIINLLPLLPEGPLVVSADEAGVTITTSQGPTVLRTVPSADFPIMPTIEEVRAKFTIPPTELRQGIERVSFAAGNVENRPQFNGVLLSVATHQVTLVATDGYRLAETVLGGAPTGGEGLQLILPIATAQEIARVAALIEGGEATITASENQVDVAYGEARIISRVVDGAYPDYLPLFPSTTATEVACSRSDLSRAVKAAMIFSRAGMADIVLEVAPGRGAVTVSAENADVGAHQTTIAGQGRGEPATATLNARYLLDGLAAVPTPEASLAFSGADRPILVTPSPRGSSRYRYLIMPIRR